MNIELVLKTINEAIGNINSARYFAEHDMPSDVIGKCSEAIGGLQTLALYIGVESELKNDLTKRASSSG